MNDTKWIKVTEKLPSESDGYVLVCMPDEFPYNQGQRVRLGQYSEYAHRWFFEGGATGGSDPIAWMPLPEPICDKAGISRHEWEKTVDKIMDDDCEDSDLVKRARKKLFMDIFDQS